MIKDIIERIKFDKDGLVPVILQDEQTKQVLMLAYMNEEALFRTIEEKVVHFFSRKRKQLWKKGTTSGNYQLVKEIFIDCDNDAILIEVTPTGPTCHTGNKSCFFNKINI